MFDLFGKPEKFFPAKEVKAADFSTFVAFDIETTGLPRDSEIIEIGAVKVVNGEICDSFQEFVNPGRPIPSEITQITGITDEMVADADKIDVVLPRFRAFAGNNILVGHNALNFDCKIMGHWADKYEIFIDNDVFDTLRFVRYRCEDFPGLSCNKLSVLCDYFGIKSEIYHRADADAEVTAKLYLALQKNGKLKRKQ